MSTQVELSGEFYTHRIIWGYAYGLAQEAKERDEGKTVFRFCSLVLTYFALEGYLNFVGEILFPEIWKQERSYFGGDTEYTGTLGKLVFLREQLGLPADRGGGPFQQRYNEIQELENWRHSVVHPRIERRSEVVETMNPANVKDLWTELEEKVTEENLEQYRGAVESVCDEIQNEAQSEHDKINSGKAFGGILGIRGGEIL